MWDTHVPWTWSSKSKRSPMSDEIPSTSERRQERIVPRSAADLMVTGRDRAAGQWASATSSTAEEVAKVIRDLKMNRVMVGRTDSGLEELNADTAKLAEWADVIDATAIWDRWVNDEGGRYVYEDHRICPPWDNALIGYVNGFGNVTILSARTIDITGDYHTDERIAMVEHWTAMTDTHDIEWERVRWVMHVAVYMGGRGGGEPVQTQGPLHVWRVAVYPDGEIADVNWIKIRDDLEVSLWDTAMMVLLDTYNLCNCVNVHVVEPDRPRPQRKRLSRMGVTVSEIHVKPVSRSYRGKGTPLSAFPSSPLSAVRGHFANYGPKYGRGLLFGKYEGRYWVPQHVRGSEVFGVTEQEYAVEP